MYTPLNYDKINIAAGFNKPSTIKARNNRSFDFWERALFQRCCSVLDFTLPDEWEGKIKDFILYVLFKYGYGLVAENDKYGRFFQPCTLNGYDFYYQPVEAILSNPLLSETYTIDKDCALLKLTPDYKGVWDVIDYYAEKLSLLDNAINMSLVNSKFSWVIGAKNKAAAQALKKIMDKVNQGEPLVVYDQRIADDPNSKTEPWQFLDFGNVKERYITTEQLMDFATIIRQFDTEIGIPTIPYEKKERLVTSEAESKQVESIARVTVWMDSLKASINDIKKLFPDINLDVKLRFCDCEGKESEEDGISNA